MRKRITSKNNPVLKECIRLSQKKYRDREGKYLIEGENLIREAVLSGVTPETILICEGSRFEREMPDGVPPDPDTEICLLPPELFRKAADTVTSQGILGVVRKRTDAREQILEANSPESRYVVLDRLQDPGNIGTIIRTAEAAGFRCVIFVRGTGDPFAPKVVRAAAGALFRVPMLFVEDTEDLIAFVRKLGKRLVVTCLDDAVPYEEAGLGAGDAIVIGNEGNGCDRELIRQADLRITIPMQGKIESLNASVAAGILLYETCRAGNHRKQR